MSASTQYVLSVSATNGSPFIVPVAVEVAETDAANLTPVVSPPFRMAVAYDDAYSPKGVVLRSATEVASAKGVAASCMLVVTLPVVVASADIVPTSGMPVVIAPDTVASVCTEDASLMLVVKPPVEVARATGAA